MDAPVWARGSLACDGTRTVSLDVNGQDIACLVPDHESEPDGVSTFGLLAASLSACTAMSVRTFLERWQVTVQDVEVDVGFSAGRPPTLHRRVGVRAALDADLREQLAGVVDSTPVTVLLRDGITIVTRLDVHP
ncbi:OsmC family protein [Actinomycetospora sp. OC33-EN08]|uniref:OsmC family protein n=1 Tax=Actinomycetospora aurantiaca TaxID=3129233 RepID=A0ABU8MVF4_9PSEU